LETRGPKESIGFDVNSYGGERTHEQRRRIQLFGQRLPVSKGKVIHRSHGGRRELGKTKGLIFQPIEK